MDDCLIKTINNIKFKATPLNTIFEVRFPFVFSNEKTK